MSFPPSALQNFSSVGIAMSVDEPSALQYLCSFRGRESTEDGFRMKLQSIGGPDLHIVVTDEPSSDYATEMAASHFCLVPRGDCLFSYRLLESLAASCIPVILSDGYVLPFSEALDWSEFSLSVPERDFEALPEMLRKFTPSQRNYMRRKAGVAWQGVFASVELQVDAFVAILGNI